MPRKNPTARYTLPDDVDPVDTVCFQVSVPNDKFHIAAFKGQILALARAYSWQNDTAHTALDVAAVWRDIFDNLVECEAVPIQFRTVVACVLEYSTDDGVSWDVAFDASACVNEVIIERIEDGTVSGGSQPPGVPAPVPGQCYTYYVTLQGSQRWMSPVRVSEDDVITVSAVTGAWYDGDVSRLGRWDCPDGQAFALGTCQPGLTYDAGDPDPAIPHMALIGNIAGESPDYFIMFNTSHTVTNPVATDFFLQANDGTPADNQGSITFVVEICKDAAGDWPVFYDFTTGQHHWTINGGTDWAACGVHTASGFESSPSCAGLTDAVGIKIDWGFPVNVTQIKVHHFVPNNINGGIREVNRLDSSFIAQLSQVGGEYTTVINLTETLNGLIVLLSNGGADVGRSYIYDIEINGTGIAPVP